MTIQELNKELGNIDIYLLDQILKGRYQNAVRILDAGCGEGRNMTWFLRNKYQVYGIDSNVSAIRMLQFVAKSINAGIPVQHFQVAQIEQTPFSDSYFDAIICSAVLHFAEDEGHFYGMLGEMLRVLKTKGSLFVRMASNIGAEDKIEAYKEKQTFLPDGSMRFLLSRPILENILRNYPLTLIEPVKTVNVQDIRFMSTLVFEMK